MRDARLTVTSMLLLCAAIAGAQDTLMHAVAEERAGLWQIASPAYLNPAVNQWRMDAGYTSVGGGYASRTDRRNPDPRGGDADHAWTLGAETYTKHRSSTLWGNASYTNGKTLSVVWNETADAPLLYPYLMADSIGGDLTREVYSFAGGYADHRGRWAWGAEIAYTALLQYRDTDPRPKNVTGRFSLSAGALYRIAGPYYAGLGVSVLKYKQNNDIDFKSEMGVDKVFHLTGLGTHYNRFAGDGLSTYYDGLRWGADLSLYPSDGRGVFAVCRFSRFTFDNILSDLNKLPLASVWENNFVARAGWLSGMEGRHFGGASAEVKVSRRHGTENIFGDAASGIYPIIASNEMFADNGVSVSATGRWGIRSGSVSRLWVELTPAWGHNTTAYVEPYSYRVLAAASLTASACGMLSAGHGWMLSAMLTAGTTHPYDCDLSLAAGDAEMAGLEAAERGAYAVASARSTSLGASVGALRTIAGRYAVSLGAGWAHLHHHGSMSRDNIDIKISFIF
ncbi:MAG: hypothetical protein K2H87_04720 [Duncaniella sp.]|nr:hypothetical protein [Duncaniella sp.]